MGPASQQSQAQLTQMADIILRIMCLNVKELIWCIYTCGVHLWVNTSYDSMLQLLLTFG